MRTVIVIVDGIDEASDLREVIVNLILRQLYDRGHTIVATSRPEGVQKPDGSLVNPELGKFTILDLAPLTKKQQKRAIKAQLIGNLFFDNLDGFSEVSSEPSFVFLSRSCFSALNFRCDPVTTNCMILCLRNGKWRSKQALIGPKGPMASWIPECDNEVWTESC